jgi:RNA polymerase sigma-70 factor (ECF subfamily)
MPVARDATNGPDVGQFEAFVREYQDMVYAVAVRLLANPADAEDVAQTVFLKAYERFSEIASHPAVAGWLKTVTTNLCINHLARYRSRWRLFSEMSDAGRDAVAQHAAPIDIAAEADQADAHARLERALARLPAHQRVPLVLFHFEHQSYQDIARLLDVSLGKLKTDMHRGRAALREVLS